MRRRAPLWMGACLLAACGGSASSAPAPFNVAAAASLTDVIDDALERWNADPSHQPGRATFAASSTLARQIEAGARYELLLSANREWVDYLVVKGRAAGPPEALATNDLAVVSSGGIRWPMEHSETEREDYRHLVGRRWTTADPAHVPLGRAARAYLESQGWWGPLSPELVVTKDARAALRLVERGEVEWGIVYRTDVRASDSVRAHPVRLDDRGDAPCVTALLVGGRGEGAAAFLAWLAGPEGQALWKEHGFFPPEHR